MSVGLNVLPFSYAIASSTYFYLRWDRAVYHGLKRANFYHRHPYPCFSVLYTVVKTGFFIQPFCILWVFVHLLHAYPMPSIYWFPVFSFTVHSAVPLTATVRLLPKSHIGILFKLTLNGTLFNCMFSFWYFTVKIKCIFLSKYILFADSIKT